MAAMGRLSWSAATAMVAERDPGLAAVIEVAGPIRMHARFVKFPDELYQVNRVLKRLLRFVVSNINRAIASKRENVSDR